MPFANWAAYADGPTIDRSILGWTTDTNVGLWRANQFGITTWYQGSSDSFANDFRPVTGQGEDDQPLNTSRVPAVDAPGSMYRSTNADMYAKSFHYSMHDYSNSSAGWALYEDQESAPVWLFDRLVETGEFDGTITTSQTTNLPSTALTRYTSGVGVWPVLEVDGDWDPAHPNGTHLTISYTNQAGTSGRTGYYAALSDGNFRDLLFAPIVLQDGDTGCRSIESVQLSSSANISDFRLLLVKPLCQLVPSGLGGGPETVSIVGWNEKILQGACLMMVSTQIGLGNLGMSHHYEIEWGAYP